MSDGLLGALSDELAKLFQPLAIVIDNPLLLDSLLAQIGASSELAGGDALLTALTDIAEVAQQLDQLSSQPSPSFAGIAALLEASKNAFEAIRGLGNAGGPATAIENFGRDLAGFLLSAYLFRWHPLAREIAALLTIVEPADTQASQPVQLDANNNIIRFPFRVDQFHFDRLSKLLSDPSGTLRAAYGNDLLTVADANAMADKLFPRLLAILRNLGVTCRYGFNPDDAPLFGDAAPFVDHALIVYAADQALGADVEAGVILTLSSADRGDLGLLVTPFGSLQIVTQAGAWKLEVDFTADVQGFAYGRHGATILASASTAEIDAAFTATLPTPTDGPAFIVGSADGSRLEVGGAQLKAATSLSEAKQSFSLSAEVSKSAIVIAAGDGDSFLKSVLPADGLRANFDLGIAWSDEGGLTFKGSAGLDATFPIGLSIGGVVTIPAVHLGIQAGDTGAAVQASVDVGLTIGPVSVLVSAIGVTAALASPEDGGNCGVVDLTFAFKPPSGAGISIDSAGVSGGGFLGHNEAAHEYTGVLQLQFDEITLQAFGLITTQVAGGSGYSLLALIDADFPPIQLGWGFTLNGVGGLLAMHRTADTDALRASLKAGQLSTILFPKNAITNAAQVLAELNTLFPTAQGRFLFGPMALIGWGTPTIITAAVAVILELPQPVRIILLARINAGFPSASNPLVRINLDALGVLDFSQGQLSLDASLYDSRIMQFTLTGDMALRANWLVQREFLLAVGGFHPQFTPPAGFPTLKRITIDMASNPGTKLRLAAYIAITSNTIQFGAALDVFIGVSGYGLAGHLAFDALLQIEPFHFAADISGSVALMAGGDDLMSVGLDATLTGPAPWNIAGDFKVHLFFFDISKSFSYTWGDSTSAPAIPPVNVLSLISAAVADSRNWQANLPSNSPQLVSVRSHDGATVVAHPLASLEMHETVAPLGLQIDRFGSAAITGPTTFTLTGFHINNSPLKSQPVQEDFAPAQFFNLSDDQKLAGPSFERHDAGAVLLSALPTSGGAAPAKSVGYQTFYIDTPGAEPREDPGPPQHRLFDQNFLSLLSWGASGRAPIRQAGNARYQSPGKPVSVAPLAFTIADTATLTAEGIAPAAGVTYSEARAALAAAASTQPAVSTQLQIVATYEIAHA